MNPDSKRYTLSVTEVDEQLGVSPGTVRRWTDTDPPALESRRTPGNARRFAQEDVDTLLWMSDRPPPVAAVQVEGEASVTARSDTVSFGGGEASLSTSRGAA
jgi:excisionase family DNA binding protein